MPALRWFHPCELQSACQCDYVHVELILMVPEEQYVPALLRMRETPP